MLDLEKWESDYNPAPTGLKYIDHMVGNVGWNEMNIYKVKWYEDVMDLPNCLSFGRQSKFVGILTLDE